MSFIKKIHKYISNFSTDVNGDESELLIDTPVEYDEPASIKGTFTPSVVEIDIEPELDALQVGRIFDKVLEIFNSSLPQFLGSSVDVEKQKKYLYDNLELSVKEYLSSLEEDAQARSMAQWQNERNEQKRQLENLRLRTRELEAKRAEINEQKLSSDRQRRALIERVRDLERKITELEADREQLEIENKGLINKAKVANVYEADLEAMRAELSQLKASPVPKEITDENARLKDEVEQKTVENNKLSEELKKMKDACEAAKVKDEMEEAMFKDMQKLAAETNKNLKESEASVARLNEELKIKDARIDDLGKSIKEKDDKIAELEDSMNEVNTIAQQLEAFADVKKRLEDKAAKLSEELKETKKENATLRSTIQSNLYTHAQQEKAMRDEINQLKTSIGKADSLSMS